MDGRIDPSREWRPRVGLFCLAAAARLTYLALARPGLEGHYWWVADSIVTSGTIGHGASTGVYEPVYPMFLAAARVLSRGTVPVIQVLQLLIDALGAVGLYLLADALTSRRRTAIIAGALYALYPLLIHHAVVADEYSFVSVMLIGFACTVTTATTARRAGVAGLWFGLAMLTRSVVAPAAALVTMVLVMNRRRNAALAFVVAATFVTLPWAVRNYFVSGTPWPARSGENLFHGNSRYAGALLPDYQLDVLGDYGHALVAQRWPHLLVPAPEGEIWFNPAAGKELDQAFTTLAWEEIRANPLKTIQLKFRNVAYFFWPRLVPTRLTHDDTRILLEPDGQVRVENSAARPLVQELAYSVSYVFVATAALIGVWLRRRHLRHDAVLWCIVVTFVAAHVVYFPTTRYRLPMEFILLFYAAVALDATAGRLSATHPRPVLPGA